MNVILIGLTAIIFGICCGIIFVPRQKAKRKIKPIPVPKRKRHQTNFGCYIEAWIPIISETYDLRIWLQEMQQKAKTPKKEYPRGYLLSSADVNIWRVPVIPETLGFCHWLNENEPHNMTSDELKQAYNDLDYYTT